MSDDVTSPPPGPPEAAPSAPRTVTAAPRMLTCPYCNYRQPAREGMGAQFCHNCDERLLPARACPEYQPLDFINYALDPDPPVTGRPRSTRPAVAIIRDPQTPDPDDAGADEEAEQERREILAAYQPWYFRSWVILVLLLTITPLGLVLLWEQRPREAFFGGAVSRFLITLLLAPAWVVCVVAAQPLFQEMASRITAVERVVRAGHWITRADYDALETGDTYQQVKGILGQEGDVTSRFHLDAQPGGLPPLDTVVYQWLNPDGSSIRAVFQNNILQKKSQTGLQ